MQQPAGSDQDQAQQQAGQPGIVFRNQKNQQHAGRPEDQVQDCSGQNRPEKIPLQRAEITLKLIAFQLKKMNQGPGCQRTARRQRQQQNHGPDGHASVSSVRK